MAPFTNSMGHAIFFCSTVPDTEEVLQTSHWMKSQSGLPSVPKYFVLTSKPRILYFWNLYQNMKIRLKRKYKLLVLSPVAFT